jgi:hypothetical protein
MSGELKLIQDFEVTAASTPPFVAAHSRVRLGYSAPDLEKEPALLRDGSLHVFCAAESGDHPAFVRIEKVAIR